MTKQATCATCQLPKAAVDWLMSGDTGVSSETIWSVLAGSKPRNYPDVPHDPDDFGRCYRLLEAVPAWRDRLWEVAERYPKWAKLVDAWPELEAMWREVGYTRRWDKTWNRDAADRMYARMRELINSTSSADRQPQKAQ